MAIVKNNCKMVCLIMEYANENNIKLEFTEADIKNEILSHYSNVYQDLSLIDEDIIYTLYLYRNNDNINIIYSNNSELLKYFERISARRNSTSYGPYNNNVNMNIDNGNCNFLLHKTILDNNPTMVKLIMYNANKKNLLLDINLIDVLGDYPLLWAIIKNNSELVNLIINYANKQHIKLRLNDKDAVDNYPLLTSINNNNIKIVQSIIDYADRHKIILDLNKRKKDGNHPLLSAIVNNNVEIVDLIINYALNHKIILKVDEKDLEYGILNNNSIHGIRRISDINMSIFYLLYLNKIEIFYDNNSVIFGKFNEINKINEKILVSIIQDDIDNLMFILGGLNNNSILLINNKDNDGKYPILWAIINNNVEMVKLIMECAYKNNVILTINDRTRYGDYPLLTAVTNNNVEMTHLIIDYAKKVNILLKINENDIIYNYLRSGNNTETKINMNIIGLLYINKNDIDIVFSQDDKKKFSF